jgi:molecular chaperone GrpE (heat shock protein)
MEKALQPTEEVVASLPPEVQELAKLRNKDFQAFVRERIKRQMEALLPTIEDLTRMLEPSNVERDFNRDELERMLR